MEESLVQAPSDSQQNGGSLSLSHSTTLPLLSYLSPSPTSLPASSSLLAPILKQYYTHIPVDIGMERDVGVECKRWSDMVNLFEELMAS